MKPGTVQRLQAAASAAFLLLWMLASHWGSVGVGPVDVNVAVAMWPFAAAWGLLCWRAHHWAVRGVGGVLGAVLLAWVWPWLRPQVAWLHFLQLLGIHLMLAVMFGKSLLGPGDALITSLAKRIFPGPLSERKVRYTRGATLAWTVFFCLNALVSTGLFAFASVQVWSVHANLLMGPLVALMFVAEHAVRVWVLPPHERPTLRMVLQAWRAQGGKP